MSPLFNQWLLESGGGGKDWNWQTGEQEIAALIGMSKFRSTFCRGEYEADISLTHQWTVGRQPCPMGVVGEGECWWHSLSHHSKMKINYWKPEWQPSEKSLQTWRAPSCELGAAKDPVAAMKSERVPPPTPHEWGETTNDKATRSSFWRSRCHNHASFN